ncbi:hypothetical protein LCGC14_1689330 [marine sediment metagenome]|uniref:Uncharacterized protein n=1 Tax=marine sediment metagenome TaxID=412755 RepID=A0A0F9I8V4_9ZZZZ
MSITTRDARGQLAVAAQAVADTYKLPFRQDSIFQEEFRESGVYLHSSVAIDITQSGTTLASKSGSTLTFILSVVVHPGDFAGPERDMPGNVDDVTDSIISEIHKLNVANQDSTTKIRIEIAPQNLHDYDFEIHQGLAQSIFKILYTHVGN